MAVYQKKDSKGNILITKDKRSWWFKVYVNGRAVVRGSFKSKTEAKDEQYRFLMNRDNPVKKKFHYVALNYFEDALKYNRESTINSYIQKYNKHIKPMFENKDINISLEQYKEWVEYINNQEYSTEYKNNLYTIFCNILDYAIKNYELTRNIAKNYGTFKKSNNEVKKDESKFRYITLEEFNKFISVINDEHWHCFFITLFYTGCRKSEIFALKWSDISFDNNEISITKTISRGLNGEIIVPTKNNKNRKIVMNKTLKDELDSFKQFQKNKYNDFNEDWFVFGSGYIHLARETADRYKTKYFKESGVREITMHEFRHSCVSLLINEYVRISKEKGVKVDTAKFFLMMSNRMGHSVDTMQRYYLHIFPSMQDEIVDIFDNI